MFKSILLVIALSVLVGPAAPASSTKRLPPIPTPAQTLAAPADPDHFTFVVSGDNRSPGHGYPMPVALEQICREIGWIGPAFTLWTGDVIEGYGDSTAEANAEYDVFLKAVSLTGTPVFNCPGNHEFSLDPPLLPVYIKRIGPLYGSLDYGNSHFVCLNTSPVGADGKITSGTLDDAQWTWLEADLQANRSAKNIFVFLHHFVFGPSDVDFPDLDTGWKSREDRDRLHALMVKYGVRAVFCGHNHIYWHAKKDGVDYFISGGAGAPLDASPEKGGYLHYLLIQVSGRTVTTQILQPWHLELDYPDGDGKGAASERAWGADTNDDALTVTHLVFHLAPPPANQPLAVQGVISYRGKTKPVVARIVSVRRRPKNNDVEVVVETELKKARTVELSVGPATKVAP